jgi:tetratricopeptide (TPR) repeat protein
VDDERGPSEAEDLAAWRSLRAWLSQDAEGRQLLGRLGATPETTAKELVAFLQRRLSQATGFNLDVGDEAAIAKLVATGVHYGDVFVGHRRDIDTGRPGRVRFGLPRVVTHFTGRDTELAYLERALDWHPYAVITQTISGLGGVGKTQLAAAYAHRHADEYQVVAWVRAEDGGTADLAALAGQLNLSAKGLTPDEQAQRAIRWLESTERSWLLILDNVAAPGQLASTCPGSGPGRVLVTSRRRDFDEFGPVIDVGVFDETTAVEYLVNRTGRIGERAAARRVAEALGYLPLALSHAAAYCSVGTTFEDYLDLLGELPSGELYASKSEVFYKQTVATTWQMSVAAAEAAAPMAGRVLAMAVHLAPDAIPRSLFDHLVHGEGVRARQGLVEGLAALHRYSLVGVTDSAVTVHRLLQKVVREDAQASGDTTGGEAALAALTEAFPERIELPSSWARCEQYLPHVLALGETLPPWRGSAQDMVRLLNRVTSYLHAAGHDQRTVAVANMAFNEATSYLGPEHPDTLTARANLAASHRALGRTTEAITIEEQVLADRERLLGPDHPATLSARGQLAASYRALGRTTEAIAIEVQVLADRERLLGPDHRATLAARGNLAASYRLAGRTAEAITIEEQLVVDRERLLGPDHPATLSARGQLAVSYRSAGRIAEALALEEGGP